MVSRGTPVLLTAGFTPTVYCGMNEGKRQPCSNKGLSTMVLKPCTESWEGVQEKVQLEC